jgi:hypothetical protein
LGKNPGANHIRYGKDLLVAQVDTAVQPLAEAPSVWIDLARRGPPFLVPAPYRPRLIWDVYPAGELIALSRGPDFVVEFFTIRGDRLGSLRLPLRGRAISNRDRSQLLQKYSEELPPHRADLDLARLSFPERTPAIESLRFDPTGRLWLRTTAPLQSPSQPDSLQIVVFRFGDPTFFRIRFRCFPVAFLGGDELLCREKHSTDVEYLRVFKFDLVVASQ